jgi:hypothetical protein
MFVRRSDLRCHGRRRGGLLLLSLLLALGVISMHQLSDGHILVTTTPPAGDHGHGHVDAPSTAVDHHPERGAVEPTAGPDLPATIGGVLSASAGTCPECNWHAMAEACLLTLGPITALTTARPVTSRLVPPVPGLRYASNHAHRIPWFGGRCH